MREFAIRSGQVPSLGYQYYLNTQNPAAVPRVMPDFFSINRKALHEPFYAPAFLGWLNQVTVCCCEYWSKRTGLIFLYIGDYCSPH